MIGLLNPAFVGSIGRGNLTPTQALIASFAGAGLLDALLVFDPAHYTTPGSTPGVLVDALGGPISYTAPNTQATPAAVSDSSGYYYAASDGVDDHLIASTATSQIAWALIVGRWRLTGNGNFPVTMGYITTQNGGDYGYVLRAGAGGSQWLADQNNVNGAPLVNGALDPVVPTAWSMVEPGGITGSASGLLLSLFSSDGRPVSADIAAIAIRYTNPTSDDQSAIEAKLAPMQQALLASA